MRCSVHQIKVEQPSWWNEFFIAQESRLYLSAMNEAVVRQTVRSDGEQWVRAREWALAMIEAEHAAALQERDTEVA